MARPAAFLARPGRAVAAWAALHVALGLWALWAWIHGPFGGHGVLDGAEILALARDGSTGTFETKEPLYPALLACVQAVAGDSPWAVGALGLALSLATLFAAAELARRAGGSERAAALAAGLLTLSGSTYVYAVQPLPTLLGTALCAWGALALESAVRTGRDLRAWSGGALLALAALARAPLSIVAFLLLVWVCWTGRARTALCALAALALVALCAASLWGARAWPTGAWFNLRLGNSGLRSGICDVRPGPQYDRLRLEAAFAPVDERGTPPALEAFHRRALRREVSADALGALGTLARKAYLCAYRTETVSAADFRHGFARFPLAPWLLLSFGLVAPLGLCGLLRSRRAFLSLPVAGIFAANLLWMTCARYRFPALPFLCAAGGVFIAARPQARAWLGAACAAAVLNLPWFGIPLVVPADGIVQAARLALERDRRDPRVRTLFEAAFAAGSQDARAHYEMALALEAQGPAQDLTGAETHYRRALELAPDYPEAAENLMAHLMRAGRPQEALDFARGAGRGVPWAGGLALNRAALERARDPLADVGMLEAQGLCDLALRALAGGDLERARALAREARQRGCADPRLGF